MALLRKRPDRIRGVAGSLTGKRLLIADSATPAATGVAQVAAAAGADVVVSSADHVAVDLLLRELSNSPGEIEGAVPTAGWSMEEVGPWQRAPDAAVVNPSLWSVDSHSSPAGLGPTEAAQLAEEVATSMRDSGRMGAIVIVAAISSAREDAAASAYLRAEAQRLARLFSPNGIRVNTVAIGHVASNRRGRVVASRAAPLGHVSVHPIEVGKAVWFLVNDDLSSGLAGAELTLDRGASLLRPDW